MDDTAPITALSELSAPARAFWAKPGEDDAWLPLAQHMLDSAGVAGRLWAGWVPESVKRSLAEQTGLEDDDLRTLVTWLACTHDAGKATTTFQTQLDQVPDRGRYSERLREAGLSTEPNSVEHQMLRFPHGMASGVILTRWLIEQGMNPRAAVRLASVADAHHGITSDPPIRHGRAVDAIAAYPVAWTAARQELLEWAADLTGIRPILGRMRIKLTGPALNLLTGLVIMADWIASNADAFPLEPVTDQEARLERGLTVDLTDPWEASPAPAGALADHMRQRFGWPEDRAPRPVQTVVDEVARSSPGATLMIIEAPTGEGKTESALLAAEHLAAASGTGGVIVAAPTMSTADGLLTRTLDWAERASAPGQVVSMFLGHSKSHLNQTFRELRFRDVDRDAASVGNGLAIASQWMSGRKKGILSNFCVATVDQVLFMALQARHSMLRHLGLAGKAVVIDEVHAYDAYMTEYLATALRWLARYRVPVVLLSATLPIAQRRQLIDAYESEFAQPSARELSTAYPLVTSVGAGGFRETEVTARRTDIRAGLRLIGEGEAALGDELAARLTDGGCALVICNTIARAQSAYRTLAKTLPGEVELHHAGFMASDRIAKEERLRAELGPDASHGAGRPSRRIVVATQVAEQSLDIDVDLLVTDIAPIDLVIQRIGRLHRHQRPDSDRPLAVREPVVLIRGIESLDPVPVLEGGTAAVYDPKLLLAGLAVLLDGPLEHGFARPDDIAPLVQAAYGDSPPIPDAWADAWSDAVAESERRRELARGRAATWRFPDPGSASDLDCQFRVRTKELGEQVGLAQVRDSDPSIEVIPVRVSEGGYSPLPWTSAHAASVLDPGIIPPEATARDLAAATVRLPSRFSRYPWRFDAAVEQLEASTPVGWAQSTWLRGELALPLDGDCTVELDGRRLRYDRDLGLADITDES